VEISREEIEQIANRTAEEVMERLTQPMDIHDIALGCIVGEGAIPLHGRQKRKEPCHGCRIDPNKPLEPGNVMVTTSDAVGTLGRDEVRDWCSEIIELPDGRCERVRSIREAVKECKEKYPEDTQKFFQCYAPAFSKITEHSSSNPDNSTAKQKVLGQQKLEL